MTQDNKNRIGMRTLYIRFMEPGALDKPDHLASGNAPRNAWLARRIAGAACAVLGALTFVIVAIAQPALWATPDPRISAPGFVLTAAAATISVVRRERAWALVGLGVGTAAAALVLGWLFGLAIVLAATIALIAILHAVL
jgi:hypothetical protein